MSESYLRHALNGAVLDQEQARSVFEQMSRGELSDIEIAAFLGALHARGEQPSHGIEGCQARKPCGVLKGGSSRPH